MSLLFSSAAMSTVGTSCASRSFQDFLLQVMSCKHHVHALRHGKQVERVDLCLVPIVLRLAPFEFNERVEVVHHPIESMAENTIGSVLYVIIADPDDFQCLFVEHIDGAASIYHGFEAMVSSPFADYQSFEFKVI
jgi:hypothetical protein